VTLADVADEIRVRVDVDQGRRQLRPLEREVQREVRKEMRKVALRVPFASTRRGHVTVRPSSATSQPQKRQCERDRARDNRH
jgi:hypothetical protein